MNILDRILKHKLAEVAAAIERRPLGEVRAEAEAQAPARGFARAIRGGRPAGQPRRPGTPPRVIAEVKRASPSAGVIRADFDPAALARGYEAGGAAAISCLTDECFFHGSLDALRAVRAAVALPVLRKEFMLDTYQIWEARAAGADAILLIAGFVPWGTLAILREEARAAGLDVLLEIHRAEELGPALALAPDVLGINNRDLRSEGFKTDLALTEQLAGGVPPELTLISESGIRARADVERLMALGVDGILVGEHLMREPDPGRAIAEKLGLGAALAG
jgi:indole-3-glycerol phosphate synthase